MPNPRAPGKEVGPRGAICVAQKVARTFSQARVERPYARSREILRLGISRNRNSALRCRARLTPSGAPILRSLEIKADPMSGKKAQKAAAKAAPKTAVEESDDNSDNEEFGMGAAFAKSSEVTVERKRNAKAGGAPGRRYATPPRRVRPERL